MKTFIFSLFLTSLLATPVWAAEQAVDSEDLKSPDQVSDKYNDVKVPGEAQPQDGQANGLQVMCEGGACPRRN